LYCIFVCLCKKKLTYGWFMNSPLGTFGLHPMGHRDKVIFHESTLVNISCNSLWRYFPHLVLSVLSVNVQCYCTQSIVTTNDDSWKNTFRYFYQIYVFLWNNNLLPYKTIYMSFCMIRTPHKNSLYKCTSKGKRQK